MPEIRKYDMRDLGGGLNATRPASEIEDNEFAELVNWYPYHGRLRKRRGVYRLSDSAYSENLTSVFTLKEGDDWKVILGTRSGLALLNGSTVQVINPTDGSTFVDSGQPWDFHQYKGVGYALRSGLRRFQSDFHESAGIPAPVAAPTIAQGSAGSIEAGTYYGVYTYLNVDTGVESNPSPASSSLSLAASKRINWTDLVPSPTRQVSGMRLYRTLPNQRGEYFFVTQINDNVHTSYPDENIVLDDLGVPVSFNNGLPPGGFKVGAIWEQRLFATDGVQVYFSEDGLVECFNDLSIVAVYPEDGHPIRALAPLGQRLLIGKTKGIYYLLPAGPGKFEREALSYTHGIYSHYSVKEAESHLFFFGGDDFYRTDGTTITAIGSSKIRTILDRIPDDLKEYVSSAILPEMQWYLTSVPIDDSSTNQMVLVYNYKDGTWTTFSHPTDAPAFMGNVFSTDYEHKVYAVFYDKYLYEYLSGYTDWGNHITASLKTKQYGLDKQGMMKGLRRTHVLCDSIGQDITLRAYRDGSSTPIKSRTVNLSQTRDWKVYSLNTVGTLGANIQVGIEYSGDEDLELRELAFDTAEFYRVGRAL